LHTAVIAELDPQLSGLFLSFPAKAGNPVITGFSIMNAVLHLDSTEYWTVRLLFSPDDDNNRGCGSRSFFDGCAGRQIYAACLKLAASPRMT
jgi:hypothetical protein